MTHLIPDMGQVFNLPESKRSAENVPERGMKNRRATTPEKERCW